MVRKKLISGGYFCTQLKIKRTNYPQSSDRKTDKKTHKQKRKQQEGGEGRGRGGGERE